LAKTCFGLKNILQREIQMIGYITIGVSDIDKASSFYDDLLAEVGAKQLFGQDRIKFYGTGPGAPMLAICIPYDEQTPQHGNGNMIAIPGGDRAGVDRLYAKAMELGASDEGEPGERLPIFYGAYVRDPDGNKLCFYEMKM
tara:strand:- start:82 stop:504 length:423 start_codon:yes stop_codon:yes gene_type:complete